MPMLFLRAAALIASGLIFWSAIYQLFSAYLSAVVAPPLTPAVGGEVWLWACIAIVCVAPRLFLKKGIGISIAAHRRKSKFIQKLWIGFGGLSFAAGLFGLLALLFPLWGGLVGFYHPPWSGMEALFWLALVALAEIGNKSLNPIMAAAIMPEADKVLKDDPRPPVVYLRAFDVELSRATPGRRLQSDVPRMIKSPGEFALASHGVQTTAPPSSIQRMALTALSGRGQLDPQAAFAIVMNSVGPYIAIGRPGEGESGIDIGAAKKYVGDHEWQDVVKEWIERAAVLVFEVGPTKGLLWELSYAMQNAKKIRILLVLPFDEEDYVQFCATTASVFPLGLPPQRPASRLLTFDSEGKPLPLSPSTTLNITLQPFFERLGLVQPVPSVTISEDLQLFVKERVAQGEYLGASNYIAGLIREDRARAG